ncbi:MAG: noncanonical pyrimidine nucleotidase, YjjG family [Thermosipho sp. (in: Bacteria)]|nr:noncanonical pyrimidine nucleotidase, YjjG family [Thermosipho sp. (in: thermotogales)]
MKYKMIYFDLDNTILDFNKAEKYALKKIFEHLNLEFEDKYISIYKPINEKWWKLFSERKFPKEVITIERFREFFKELKIELEDYETISKLYLKNLSNAAFFIEGAEELLHNLKSKGFRMAIITNGVEFVQQNRFKLGKLDRFFEFILTSEKVGKPKPEPDIFFFAEKISKVSLSNSIYIGDNIETDYEGAKRANIDFILFDPEDKFNIDCKKAKSYKELYKMLINE